jgi:hypothetical protein
VFTRIQHSSPSISGNALDSLFLDILLQIIAPSVDPEHAACGLPPLSRRTLIAVDMYLNLLLVPDVPIMPNPRPHASGPPPGRRLWLGDNSSLNDIKPA